MWLRSGIAVATAPIGPLAWKPPYAADAALEKNNKKKESHLEDIFYKIRRLSIKLE